MWGRKLTFLYFDFADSPDICDLRSILLTLGLIEFAMESISDASRRKRKQRAVLSCNDCRRRKLKCDRELPCNRCIHGGVADKCAYGNDGQFVDENTVQRMRKSSHRSPQPVTVPTSHSHRNATGQETYVANTSSEHTSTDRVTELEQRLAFLEAQLSSLQHKSDHHLERDVVAGRAHVEETSSVSALLFKGRDYRTFYYGPTCPMMAITYVSAIYLIEWVTINDDSSMTSGLS
jgi:hypothetical protein